MLLKNNYKTQLFLGNTIYIYTKLSMVFYEIVPVLFFVNISHDLSHNLRWCSSEIERTPMTQEDISEEGLHEDIVCLHGSERLVCNKFLHVVIVNLNMPSPYMNDWILHHEDSWHAIGDECGCLRYSNAKILKQIAKQGEFGGGVH